MSAPNPAATNPAPTSSTEPNDVEVLREAYLRVVDTLVDGAVRATNGVSWPTWELGADGRPDQVRAGRPSLYDGDTGIALALAAIGPVCGRDDATELAQTVLTGGHLEVPPGDDPTLLSGWAGISLARRTAGPAPAELSRLGPDLGSGVAGIALVTDDERVVRAAVERLARLREPEPIGSSWPDRLDPDPRAQRPLCGLAHGASGIALALSEIADRFPELADEALTLADEALWWESAWFDPIRGGWPDLRADDEGDADQATEEDPQTYGYPDLWCHGAAGIGLVRLRLLQLADRGLTTPWPTETIRAEAEAAVGACGRSLARAATEVPRVGWSVAPGGLTLCHGLAGPLEVLLTASRTWSAPSHLAAARRLAAEVVRCLPDDPWQWPSGILEATGVAGLFVGTAGTALTLARLVHPDAPLFSAASFGRE